MIGKIFSKIGEILMGVRDSAVGAAENLQGEISKYEDRHSNKSLDRLKEIAQDTSLSPAERRAAKNLYDQKK